MNRRTFLKSLVAVVGVALSPFAVNNAEAYSGSAVWGEKTLAKTNLDQISLRRYCADVKLLLESYRFELNDKITRYRIVAEINSLSKLYVGRYLFREYLIVCDESNNSPKTMDKGRLIVDTYIQGYYTWGHQHTRFTLGGK